MSLKQSSFSSPPPSLSSGSSDLLFGSSGRHRWLRLLLVTAGIYLVLLPLWWQSLGALSFIIATCADVLYHLLNSRVSINPEGSNINFFVKAAEQSGFAGQVHASGMRLSTITYGMPMLVALILSTRADTIVAKLKALGTGLLVMFVLTIPAVMVWAAMTSLQLEDRISRATHGGGGSDQASFLYYVFHGYAFSQPVVAAGIWMALVMLGFFKQKPKEQEAAAAAVGRNDPCPCGSGKKFKRCCAGA